MAGSKSLGEFNFSTDLNLSLDENYLMVGAIDFGTTFSGYALILIQKRSRTGKYLFVTIL